MEYSYQKIEKKYNKDFKKNEKGFDHILSSQAYYIIRFDGMGMTKRFRPQKELFDLHFVNSIKETFSVFCKNHDQQIKFGYQCNDEISVLIKSIKQGKENTYNRVEKLLSLFASEISVLFDRHFRGDENNQNELNIFDARIFRISEKKILEYFCLRQAFGIEHITTRMRNLKKNVNKDEHPDVYYGSIFKASRILPSFEFKGNEETLKEAAAILMSR